MTNEELNEKYFGISEPEWWSQETQAVFQLCYPWMRGFARIHEIYDKGYEVAIIPFKNDYGWHFLDKNKSIELAEYVINKYLEDKNYFKDIIGRWNIGREKLLSSFTEIDNTNWDELDSEVIYNLYNKLFLNYCEEFSYPLVLEAFEPYTSDILLKRFDNLNRSEKQQLALLSQPKFQSFVSNYQISLLNLIKDILQDSLLYKIINRDQVDLSYIIKEFPEFYNKLKIHQQKYFWMKNTYKNIQYINELDFIHIIKDEIAGKSMADVDKSIIKLNLDIPNAVKESRQAAKNLKLDQHNRDIFCLFDELGPWHDERKRLMMMAGHYITLILKQIGQLKDLSINYLNYYTPEEIQTLLINNIYVDSNLLKERRKFSIWVGQGRQEKWFIGKEAGEVSKLVFRNTNQISDVISGIPASSGFAIGRVKIVLDAINDTIEPGDILVAAMTRPEFLPLMKKAKAIITDEGGLTCHAAIVSRELGIPCVVGTRVATKALNNGDEVEVRAHRGEIKIIK